MTVTVTQLRGRSVDAIRITMADEIERGEVELHGKKVVNVAVFHMTDPAKYVGDLSIRNPEYQHSLSLLARRLYKAMEVTSGVVD